MLALATQGNVIRAGLVTREGRVASLARKSFALNAEDGTFDPLEAWYQLKLVIAACLDIGRTLAREIYGIAIVGDGQAVVAWGEREGETLAEGRVVRDGGDPREARPRARGELRAREETKRAGTLEHWFLWNLTGWSGGTELGQTRVQWPFDAGIKVLAMVDAVQAKKGPGVRGESGSQEDRAIVEAGAIGWDGEAEEEGQT